MNVLDPAIGGADRVTAVFSIYLLVKVVLPHALELMSGVNVTVTPLSGDDFTIRRRGGMYSAVTVILVFIVRLRLVLVPTSIPSRVHRMKVFEPAMAGVEMVTGVLYR